MFATSSAWFLLLLVLVVPGIWLARRRWRQQSIRYSSVAAMNELPRSWRQRLAWLPAALGVAAIVLMIVALARPQEGRKRTVSESEGIAIEMVVDCSGSMQAMDFEVNGQPVDRLTAIKRVAADFVMGNDELDGRFSDLTGLITFARFADALNPPTLDHEYLVAQLDDASIVRDRAEDGTAIGDAIGLAVEKLNDLNGHQPAGTGSDENLQSKVIILLTDGENNAGELEPMAAAELARALDIRIYTIGVGTRGQAPVPVTDPYSGRQVLQMMPVNIDEETLQQVADLTGGRYFRATDTRSLEAIYEEIDALEKTEVESQHLVDYRELAIEPVHAGWANIPPLVVLALLCLAGQLVLRNTLFWNIAE